jgi:SAM-dependent methyltransferase
MKSMKIKRGESVVGRSFQDRTSWYDGYLYEKIMGSMADEMFVRPISGFIESGSSVIDIGCGIGSLVLELSNKCSKIIGIDVSSRMIAYAKKRLMKKRFSNVEFHHLCASLLPEVFSGSFDYAVMSQIFHEISEELRNIVIASVKEVARTLIIADYISPLPKDGYGRMIQFVELLAGSEHNRNFKSWQSHGGLDGFLSYNRLKAIQVTPYQLKGRNIGVGKIVKVSY